jgi:hypothetical protein
MSEILEWVTRYSPPVILLLAAGAAVVYVLEHATEQAIKTQFDRYSKEMELRLKRRSDFEQKILLDRYELVTGLAVRLGRVTTDLNRARHGTVVEGLFRDNDIVPLTSVFEELAVKRFLLTERFHAIFQKQAHTVLRIANAKDDAERGQLEATYVQGLDELNRAVNQDFGLEKISWGEMG